MKRLERYCLIFLLSIFGGFLILSALAAQYPPIIEFSRSGFVLIPAGAVASISALTLFYRLIGRLAVEEVKLSSKILAISIVVVFVIWIPLAIGTYWLPMLNAVQNGVVILSGFGFAAWGVLYQLEKIEEQRRVDEIKNDYVKIAELRRYCRQIHRIFSHRFTQAMAQTLDAQRGTRGQKIDKSEKWSLRDDHRNPISIIVFRQEWRNYKVFSVAKPPPFPLTLRNSSENYAAYYYLCESVDNLDRIYEKYIFLDDHSQEYPIRHPGADIRFLYDTYVRLEVSITVIAAATAGLTGHIGQSKTWKMAHQSFEDVETRFAALFRGAEMTPNRSYDTDDIDEFARSFKDDLKDNFLS